MVVCDLTSILSVTRSVSGCLWRYTHSFRHSMCEWLFVVLHPLLPSLDVSMVTNFIVHNPYTIVSFLNVTRVSVPSVNMRFFYLTCVLFSVECVRGWPRSSGVPVDVCTGTSLTYGTGGRSDTGYVSVSTGDSQAPLRSFPRSCSVLGEYGSRQS